MTKISTRKVPLPGGPARHKQAFEGTDLGLGAARLAHCPAPRGLIARSEPEAPEHLYPQIAPQGHVGFGMPRLI